MKTSILIACLNEGENLTRTVESCVNSSGNVDYELIVADNSSTDGSLEATTKRFPQVHVEHVQGPQSAAIAKHQAALAAKGEVLIFLDGHCHVASDAISQFVQAIDETEGQAIILPRIAALDVQRWAPWPYGYGGPLRLDLETFEYAWGRLRSFRVSGRFFESPGLLGCAFATSRELYRKLGGLDAETPAWGSEDLDFGLTAWLMGYRVLHDPIPLISHRFRDNSNPYPSGLAQSQANKLRLARKHLSNNNWTDWLGRFEQRLGDELACSSWNLFVKQRPTAESWRERLFAQRVHDEEWFAERFGLAWPLRKLGC